MHLLPLVLSYVVAVSTRPLTQDSGWDLFDKYLAKTAAMFNEKTDEAYEAYFDLYARNAHIDGAPGKPKGEACTLSAYRTMLFEGFGQDVLWFRFTPQAVIIDEYTILATGLVALKTRLTQPEGQLLTTKASLFLRFDGKGAITEVDHFIYAKGAMERWGLPTHNDIWADPTFATRFMRAYLDALEDDFNAARPGLDNVLGFLDDDVQNEITGQGSYMGKTAFADRMAPRLELGASMHAHLVDTITFDQREFVAVVHFAMEAGGCFYQRQVGYRVKLGVTGLITHHTVIEDPNSLDLDECQDPIRPYQQREEDEEEEEEESREREARREKKVRKKKKSKRKQKQQQQQKRAKTEL